MPLITQKDRARVLSCLVPPVAGQSVSGQVGREDTEDTLGDLGAVRAACGALAGYLD
jgi:hypothetical protein